MHVYADSLGKPTLRPRVARRPSMAGALALTAALTTATLLLWPRQATAAGAFHRMDLAIRNARTMESTGRMLMPGGKWREFLHVYYRRGAWRYDVSKSDAMRMTYLVRGNEALTDFWNLDHATLGPVVESAFDGMRSGEMDALEYAKQSIGGNQDHIKPQIQAHAPVDGRPAYQLSIDDASAHSHAEFVVDRQTDLPISAEIRAPAPGWTGDVVRTQTYHFNEELPESTFSFERNKPIIRVSEARSELLASWRKPLGQVAECTVRDAAVTPDGTIWLAITTPGDPWVRPASVTAGGATYLRSHDVSPGVNASDQDSVEIDGQPVSLVPFVSLDPTQPLPRAVTVRFAKRAVWWSNFGKPEDRTETPADPPLKLALRQEANVRPHYFAALSLDRYGFDLGIVAWSMRAEEYDRRGDLLAAAKAWEECAVAHRGVVKYGGHTALERASDCYRRAGEIQLADQRAKEAAVLFAGKER
ncbi:hypothetical protein OP10G_1312 [Fimbriimonas ginsengisoli Gsoil 348]|uniref:Uncharacterized protein n=2 Tax=Fimbriimonas ginsengisoli TaxID=1005039 RepID=A0A068NPL1_FIMGI|nr:hypothetical protein OP10G_1312 [Fimbriimonas ginsengisoli Gsoil 348]